MYRVSFKNPKNPGEWISVHMEQEMSAVNYIHENIRGYYDRSEKLEDGTMQFWRGDSLRGSIRPLDKEEKNGS